MPRKSKKKKPPEKFILVDREAFLSATQLTSIICQSLGEEIEALRQANLAKEVKFPLRDALAACLKNTATIARALQLCIYDDSDPFGTKLRDLN